MIGAIPLFPHAIYNPARINLLVENEIITHVTMGN